MVRIKVTPILRKKKPGFAGMPGYVTKLRPPTSIRPRETLGEWRAKLDKKEQEWKEYEMAVARREPEVEGFAEMRTHWIRMRTAADDEPHKDWKLVARRLRPKFTLKGPFTGYKVPPMECWDRIDALKLDRRGKGFWNSYRFLARFYRAFMKIGVHETLMYLVAADYDHEDQGFARWFFRFRADLDYYITWNEFAWCLFVYVMAFEM